MENANPNISIITLNVECLNILIKRQRLAGWIKNHDSIQAVYKTDFNYNTTEKYKVKGWKRYLIQTLMKRKSDYIDSRSCRLKSEKNFQGQRGTLNNNKKVNPLRRHNNPKGRDSKHQNCKMSRVRGLIKKEGEIDKFTLRELEMSISHS